MERTMNHRIFREYDIRGVADLDLDDQLVRDLGAVFARTVKPRLPGGRATIAVGRDCRLHSSRLFTALTDGLRTHADVIDLAEIPSPILYFAAHHLEPDAAVMITGSHNPAEDNGFKLMVGQTTLHGADIAALRDGIGALRADATPLPPSVGAMRILDVVQPYLDHAVSQLRLGGRRCKVVVDAGNGSGGPAAVALYRRLGFDVVPLHCDPDGRFPHHHPDPTVPENLDELRARVASERAEVGIALDGDADRIGAVDGTGRILWGDQLMILFGKAVLAEVPGAKFVGEVKCSQAMFDELARAGGEVEMWKVGHSLIKARMKEIGAQLAGEMSGHMFFAHRYLGFDDGIYAGARLLELISHSDRPLAALAGDLPVMVNTPEIRIACPDDDKARVVASVTAAMRARKDVVRVIDVDGVRAVFAGGWGLVRASNTQAALVMRCEAVDGARLVEIRTLLETAIAKARSAA
jgi:phosphomannomutase/phosphoglucomutase